MKNLFINDYRIIKKYVLLSIPILFIIGIPIHFLYNLSGKIVLIGAITPINESIAEHFKLATIPVILWWFISYFILRKKVDMNFKKWIFCGSISVLLIPFVIINFYYTYTGALGISTLILDIFSLFLALILGQYLALHLYQNIKITNVKFTIGVLIIITMIFLTIFCTFNAPHIPMFKDSITGGYGL